MTPHNEHDEHAVPTAGGSGGTNPTDLPLFLNLPASDASATDEPAPRGISGGGGRATARDLAGRLPAPRPQEAPAAGGAHAPTATATGAGEGTPGGDSPIEDTRPDVDPSSAPGAPYGGVDVDYAAVRDLQGRVIESFQAASEHRLTTALSAEQHGHLIRPLIRTHLHDWVNQRMNSGIARPRAQELEALTAAVDNAIFGSGRLQPLLDLEGVENIEVMGCDDVWLQFADGRVEPGPPIADSDEELIADIQQIARFAPSGEKDFSIASKKLRMALPDGSRLAAEAWMTPRPMVTIRKHRHIDTDLSDSLRLGAVDEGIASFLRAAVRSGRSFVISGLPASGKTTLARAVLNELDPLTRLATIESMTELGLHRLKHRHKRVWPAEAQPGGEPGPDGRPLGAFTLTDLIELSLQANVDRIVVGEVVGTEIMAMIEAMQAGKGSVSTMHADTAWNTVERMTTLIMRAQGNANPAFASRLVAQHVDFVVHVTLVDETDLGGGRYRFVDEILALDLINDADADPVEREYLWRAGPDGRAVATGSRPKWLPDLRRHGFDPSWLEPGRSSWTTALDLKILGEETA